MIYKPRPSQLELEEFAWKTPKNFWMASMGAGKTVAAAHYMLGRLHDSFDVKRWLVTAPKLVAETTWPQEFKKWDSLRHIDVDFIGADDFELTPSVMVRRDGINVEILYTDLKPGEKVLKKGAVALPSRHSSKKTILARKHLISVVSYDFLPWLRRACGVNWPYDGVVNDESVFLKNHESLRFKALNTAVKKGFITHMLHLSGRPRPNGIEDLWAQVLLLDGGQRMGRTLTEFHNQWCEPISKNWRNGQVYKWGVPVGKRDALYAKLSDIAISMKHNIGVPIVEVDHLFELSDHARKVYDDLWAKLVYRFDPLSVVLAANQAVLVGKLLQVTQGAIYDQGRLTQHIHDQKLDLLVDLVERTDQPLLLAYPFQHDWERLSATFGKRIAKADARSIQAFREGRLEILAAHPASMSYGVDGLQGITNQVAWFGLTSNSDHYEQFNARICRPGQDADTVYVHRIIANDTLDTKLAYETLPNKIDDEDAFLYAVRGRHSYA